MSIGNQSYKFIDFDFVELLHFVSSVLRLPLPQAFGTPGERRTEPYSTLHRFFVYPGPRGSEEPMHLLLASSAKPKSIYSPSSLSRSFSEAKGAGVNKLIFKLFKNLYA
jgi:hypothetical protein